MMRRSEIVRVLRTFKWRQQELKCKIEIWQQQIDDIYNPIIAKLDITSIRGTNYKGSFPEMAVIHKQKCEVQIQRLTVQLWQEQENIEKLIAPLPENERNILRLKYIQNCTWERVADCTNYSVRQCHRLHNASIRRLSKRCH